MTDDRRLYRLMHDTARAMAVQHVKSAPEGYSVEIRPPRRSDEQSRKMHAMARDLDEQVPWCGQRLGVDGWKRFATAKLKKDRIVFDCDDRGQPSPNAGLVVLGKSTANMTAKEMGEVIAWFEWMGAQHGVRWTDEEAPVSIASLRRG